MKTDSDCRPELLTLYHYAELDVEQAGQLESHLEQCRVCRLELEQLARLQTLRWEPELDRAAVQRIEALTLSRAGRQRSALFWPRLTFGGGLIVALMVLAVFRPAPQETPPAVQQAAFSQLEVLEKFELLEELELLENFELLDEIEGRG